MSDQHDPITPHLGDALDEVRAQERSERDDRIAQDLETEQMIVKALENRTLR